MKEVFVDTHYWSAVTRPKDPWREAAMQASEELGACRLVTSDEVFSEFLSAFSKGSVAMRTTAVEVVNAILNDANVEVVPQSHSGFLSTVALYQNRADKQYSLVDCRSMNIMKTRGIDEALTNDRHFQQEGFRVLIQAASQ